MKKTAKTKGKVFVASIIMLILFFAWSANISIGSFGLSGKVMAATYTISPKTKPCIGKYRKGASGRNLNYYTVKSYMEKFEKKKGGTLVLKKGIYYISGPVFVPSNTTIKLSKGAVIKKKKGKGSGIFYLCKPSKQNRKNATRKYLGTKNIKIISDGGGTIDLAKSSSHGIVSGHNNRVTISGIKFKNLKGGSGIRLVGCSNVTITGCSFSGVKSANKSGIQISNPDKYMDRGSYNWIKKDGTTCRNVKIDRCSFKNLGKGIATSQFTKNRFHLGICITNCKFSNLNTEGIRVINWSKPSIKNNRFEKIGLGSKITLKNTGRGINLLGVKYPVIMNNSFYSLGRIVQISKYKNENKTAKKKYGATKNVLTKDNLSHILKDNNVDNSVVEAFVRNNKSYGKTAFTPYYIRFNDYYNDSYTIGDSTSPYHHEYMEGSNYKTSTKNYYTIQSYLNHFERRGKGGTLYLREGGYSITQMVEIPSNVTIVLKDGVVISQKNSINRGYGFAFVAPSKSESHSVKGYSGVHDSAIVAESRGGATIKMKIAQGNAVVFGHNQLCRVSNIRFTGRKLGHYIEADAAKDCIIDNCIFSQGDSGVQEGINLDTPDKITGGFNALWSAKDCTANQNLEIRDCTFKGMSVGIGTHAYSYGHPHKNIAIRNCSFSDMSWRAIQTMNWQDTLIEGNTFKCNPEAGLILLRGSSNTGVKNNEFIMGRQTGTDSDGNPIYEGNSYVYHFKSAYHESATVGSAKYNVNAVHCNVTDENRTDMTDNNTYIGSFDHRIKIYHSAYKGKSGWTDTDPESQILMIP